jgi:RecA/RadA recombinase
MRTTDQPSKQPPATLTDALARLESRWGSAAIRLGTGAAPATLGVTANATSYTTEGALAPLPEIVEAPRVDPLAPLPDDVVSTGFPALDAILGPGGLPRQASAVLRGDASSGKTTLALRCLAETQSRGGIVAYLDLARSFDPVEAVARGVDLRWLVILRPADMNEGFVLAGALLAGRAIDLLVVDLPARAGAGTGHDALVRRLTAHARRVGARLLVLQPLDLPGTLPGTLAEATSLRLELQRHAWIRVGRDVVGQRTGVTVAKNRFGPPGRSVELVIQYADQGDRWPGLARRLASGADEQERGPSVLPMRSRVRVLATSGPA